MFEGKTRRQSILTENSSDEQVIRIASLKLFTVATTKGVQMKQKLNQKIIIFSNKQKLLKDGPLV